MESVDELYMIAVNFFDIVSTNTLHIPHSQDNFMIMMGEFVEVTRLKKTTEFDRIKAVFKKRDNSEFSIPLYFLPAYQEKRVLEIAGLYESSARKQIVETYDVIKNKIAYLAMSCNDIIKLLLEDTDLSIHSIDKYDDSFFEISFGTFTISIFKNMCYKVVGDPHWNLCEIVHIIDKELREEVGHWAIKVN